MHRSDYFPETYCISVVQFAIELYSWGTRIIGDCVLPIPVINFGAAGAACLSDMMERDLLNLDPPKLKISLSLSLSLSTCHTSFVVPFNAYRSKHLASINQNSAGRSCSSMQCKHGTTVRGCLPGDIRNAFHWLQLILVFLARSA
jgi:hypothetical protein